MRKIPLGRALLGGTLAGAISASVNILYWFYWPTISGYVAPEIVNVTTITLGSFFMSVLAGFALYLLGRWTEKPVRNFLILSALVFLGSLAGPLADPLPSGVPAPEGFFWLTVPMHVIAASLAVYLPIVLARESSETPQPPPDHPRA